MPGQYLLKAAESLDYLTPSLENKSETQRMHRVANKMFTDITHRCASRPAAEEWNLATFAHEQDVMNAEYMRTYMSVTFPGGQLVQRLDDEMQRQEQRVMLKMLPSQKMQEKMSDDDVMLKHYPDLYGFRGKLPENKDVYYLNPWEFLMLWDVQRLPPPNKKPWMISAEEHQAVPLSVWLEEGKYQLNPAAVQYYRSKDMLFYPTVRGNAFLRDTWFMVRRRRPMVPAPSNTPMPDKYRSPEQRARLYSVYLRAWTLEATWATTGKVPHICDLNLLPMQRDVAASRRRLRSKQSRPGPVRSYAQAWQWYMEGHVVSRHAVRIIVQFMSACCGKSRREDENEEERARQPREMRSNDLALTRLHAILDEIGSKSQKVSNSVQSDASDSDGLEDDESKGKKKQKGRRSEQMENALCTTAQLWKRVPALVS